MVDLLDTTAGAYPFDSDMPVLEELAWVFRPYRVFRASGGLDNRRPDEFESIVTDVEARILAYSAGRSQKLKLDIGYEKIGGGIGWSCIKETGAQGRIGAFYDGIEAYVIARERSDGRVSYTIGRISEFIPFDVPLLLAALNEAENDPLHLWGGGDTIGGSCRATGSRLSIREVERIINDMLKKIRGN
jgi:hypothetical protein